MSRGPGRLLQNVTQFADAQFKQFSTRYGQQVIDILDFPIKVVLSPFNLAFDIAGSAPRGFGIPEFISKAAATFGTYDIALDLGKKVICQRYLATTFKIVPRGTEGAMSIEGTLAGLLASFFLASVGCFLGQVLEDILLASKFCLST